MDVRSIELRRMAGLPSSRKGFKKRANVEHASFRGVDEEGGAGTSTMVTGDLATK
jgi:hypothetical protein